MLIRTEIPVDAAKIDKLLRHVFGRSNEADFLHHLREEGLLTLGMVATDDDGDVIGYAAFSPVDVMHEDHQWVVLAPLAVDERYRGNELAKRLIFEGMDSLNEFGYACVVAYGQADFYQRYGFRRADEYGLFCQQQTQDGVLQIHPLENENIAGLTGQIEFAPVFSQYL